MQGTIIGGCVLDIDETKTAELARLWVDEGYRRRGIGSSLIREAEQKAWEKGCRMIVNAYTFDFQEARHFFERRGYELIGTVKGWPKGHESYTLIKHLIGPGEDFPATTAFAPAVFEIKSGSEEDGEFIADRLEAYNCTFAPRSHGYFDLDKKVVDRAGRMIAGCVAGISGWDTLHIDVFWVDKPFRDRGVGSYLLGEIEREAKAKGDYLSSTAGTDSQVVFFKQQGYTIGAVLKDSPRWCTMYKNLYKHFGRLVFVGVTHMMKIDFYYYSIQCPLNETMVQLLNKYRDKLEIHFHDISQESALAKEMGMFYPTLTILNGQRRYYSPLRSSFLEQAASGIYPDERPYLPMLSSNTVTKQIVPLTNENICLACDCCGFPTDTSCAEKERFLRSCGQEIYGFLHADERGNLLGGAEYLPSMLVPYDIPHSEDAAFITCVYLSDAEYDYKSAPIKALEQYLRKTYARVFAVTDEKGVFPNGDLAFFTRNGYRDNGVVFEDQAYCKLHLVSKEL